MSSGTALTEEQVGSFGTGVDRSPSALPLILAGSRERPGSRSFQGCVRKEEHGLHQHGSLAVLVGWESPAACSEWRLGLGDVTRSCSW